MGSAELQHGANGVCKHCSDCSASDDSLYHTCLADVCLGPSYTATMYSYVLLIFFYTGPSDLALVI